jgi:hypothetical protein
MMSQRKRVAAWPRLVALTLALVAAGCASSGRSLEEGSSRDVEVTVENQNFKDAVVFAIWGAGPRDRLGMVTGNTTETFTTAARGGGDMRVEVDFIAGNDVVTERIGIFEGDDIHVVIPPNI